MFIPSRLIGGAIRVVERMPLPDSVLRAGVAHLVSTRRTADVPSADLDRAFADALAQLPVAVHTDAANRQHYELPAAFFGEVLGPRRKYSCCFYDDDATSLEEAEERALRITAERAGLADGQNILELGCGWGSLTLWMAEHLPAAAITAVSNSNGQRRHILDQARRRGLTNIEVVTGDMAELQLSGSFDRVVSVEMFEHMANWRELLARVRPLLNSEGRLFIHVFAHRTQPYRFSQDDETDWIGQHFFTGGLMPSDGLMHQFSDLFDVENEWRWSGTHYARTARDWLDNYDRNAERVSEILRETYGADAGLWARRWRLFFLAVEGLFGYDAGRQWGVKHYLLKPAAR